jgi:hypothetical protein
MQMRFDFVWILWPGLVLTTHAHLSAKVMKW